MSQGTTIKGKTTSGQNIEVAVNDAGQILTNTTGASFTYRTIELGAITYVGKAAIGASTSVAVWQVQKIDSTSGIVITWADGNDLFDNIWNNYATLNYL